MINNLDRPSANKLYVDRFRSVFYSFKQAEKLFKENGDMDALSKLLELKKQYTKLMSDLNKAKNEISFSIAEVIRYYIDDLTIRESKALKALEAGIENARNVADFSARIK